MKERSPRYLSLDCRLRALFGEKVQKIPLDAGSTCPNRDGTLSTGGCTFCNAEGSGTGRAALGLRGQWEAWRERFARSPRTRHTRLFLAYLQSFTNTYGPASRLAALLEEISSLPCLAGACVGTRPDCIDREKLALLAALPFPEFWLEIGAQTCRDDTLARINRHHSAADTEQAVRLAADFGIPVCLHLMAGLPGESGKDFLQTVQWAATLPIRGVKLHNLYFPKGAAVEKERKEGRLTPLDQDEYAALAAKALTFLPSPVVIHRLCADPAPGELAAPPWALDKGGTLHLIRSTLEYNNWWQGKAADTPENNPFLS
ncbi:TIGR01212 family radical SAM protein [Mailhella massiliensis]|uniref:TIGR01212 family radical SAM protein n=1 Tax=Mailhella massiliensis TaxID=1903261 RepID=A0A921DRX6_9BACT|nr:TIGR01212 family radical SAM protein [Mailhella massiliensis]HJD97563.1 TIGR01212 family radical SAM protein [Mailhella massiliensis]